MTGEPIWFFANYGRIEGELSSLMLALAMLGMGASLTVGDFVAVFRLWKGFAVGMVVQFVLIPVWAGVLLSLLALIPPGVSGVSAADAAGIAIGVALVAAMPGGAASNIFAFVARGNVALSIALTTIATIVCLVTTPVILNLLVSTHLPGKLRLDAPTIMLNIGLFLIAPLLMGIVLRPFLGSRQAVFTKVMVRLSLVTLVLIIAGSVGAGRIHVLRYGWLGPVVLVIFGIVIQKIGQLAAWASGLSGRDCATILIEITIKNGLLALLLLTSMFPAEKLESMIGDERTFIAAARDGCMFAILFYGGFALILGIRSMFQYRAALTHTAP